MITRVCWVLAVAASSAAGRETMRLVSFPTLSADGSRIVFEWREDLWIAPADGGEARRLTDHPARDAYPRFSRDGARVVFSSERSGALEVFSVAVAGGEALRHTRHSEGNRLECLSPCGTRAVVRGPRERSGFRPERLMEIDLTADRRERRLFDARGHSPAWSPDGSVLLFCHGGEQTYRKGFRGSRASRIWSFRPADRSFRLEVPGDFEARWPLWQPDGSGFYFVSNESGTANLWLRKIDGTSSQLTFHEDDGIVAPDLAADGSAMVFRRGAGVHLWRPASGEPAAEIELWTGEAGPARDVHTQRIRGCDSSDFHPDGRQSVFSAGGELWWIGQAGEKPLRLTETATGDDDPRFSPDGSQLYFRRDDGISANYHAARIIGGRLAELRPVTRGAGSKSGLLPSPDGRRIAWIAGTGKLHTARADGSQPRLVFPSWDKPQIDWSPDGSWLAVAADDASSNRDILLVRADGSGEPVNLTRHPAPEGLPRWSPDGRHLAFTARRDPGGRLELWLIDFGRGGPAADASPATLARAGDRARRIATRGIEPIRLIWSRDSKEIFFQSRKASNKRLYAVSPAGGMRTVAEQRGVPLRVTAGGSLLWRVNRRPAILDDSGLTVYPLDESLSRPREEVLRLGFRRIWRTLGERFHDPEMDGTDWPALREKHEPDAVSARTSRQFALATARLLGELNASHLTFHRSPWPDEENAALDLDEDARTTHLGLVFDDRETAADAPLRIARVITGTPVARQINPPLAGEFVLRIAGRPVTHLTPFADFLDGGEGRSLPLTLQAADGSQRVVEARTISYPRARALDRQQREEQARQHVAATAPGTAYLVVPDMSRPSLDQLQLDVHRAQAAGLTRMILDLRDNGGGREADRMLALFTQPRHSFTVPRDGPRGYPLDRLPAPPWHHPLVVLCNQNTYSNSEIFCHAVKRIGRAPLVGTTTAGGVISAVSVTIPDVGRLQTPIRSWFHLDTAANLDLNGADPDIPVPLGPPDEDAGRDPQLQRASDGF